MKRAREQLTPVGDDAKVVEIGVIQTGLTHDGDESRPQEAAGRAEDRPGLLRANDHRRTDDE